MLLVLIFGFLPPIETKFSTLVLALVVVAGAVVYAPARPPPGPTYTPLGEPKFLIYSLLNFEVCSKSFSMLKIYCRCLISCDWTPTLVPLAIIDAVAGDPSVLKCCYGRLPEPAVPSFICR